MIIKILRSTKDNFVINEFIFDNYCVVIFDLVFRIKDVIKTSDCFTNSWRGVSVQFLFFGNCKLS